LEKWQDINVKFQCALSRGKWTRFPLSTSYYGVQYRFSLVKVCGRIRKSVSRKAHWRSSRYCITFRKFGSSLYRGKLSWSSSSYPEVRTRERI